MSVNYRGLKSSEVSGSCRKQKKEENNEEEEKSKKSMFVATSFISLLKLMPRSCGIGKKKITRYYLSNALENRRSSPVDDRSSTN